MDHYERMWADLPVCVCVCLDFPLYAQGLGKGVEIGEKEVNATIVDSGQCADMECLPPGPAALSFP